VSAEIVGTLLPLAMVTWSSRSEAQTRGHHDRGWSWTSNEKSRGNDLWRGVKLTIKRAIKPWHRCSCKCLNSMVFLQMRDNCLYGVSCRNWHCLTAMIVEKREAETVARLETGAVQSLSD